MIDKTPSVKIVFFGTPSFVTPLLEKLVTSFSVVGVITAPDQKVGRNQLLTPSPVKQAAENLNIKAIFAPDRFTPAIHEQLQSISPDLIIVAAYGKIIPQTVLDIPTYGALNIHPSLLPTYRGASPLQMQILDGVTDSGVSIIQMDSQMDHGPIIASYPFTISQTDTFATLAKKTFSLAADRLTQTIENYVTQKTIPREQEHTQATFCSHITKDHGYLDLENPPSPEQLDRMIRAYFPWPTVWTKVVHNGQEIRIKFLPEKMVQIEGKKPVSIKDFFNGYPSLKEELSPFFE